MNIQKAVAVKPSTRQLQWQQLEFYGFVHFGMNTMTDREWGMGHEDPQLFDPAELDCRQWAEAMKSAGMKGAILTCKHHDGFCLWPSKYTKHSVASSHWKDGQGDVVKEFSEACHEAGLKFGVYLSPWDRTEGTYGTGKGYDDYYVAQLTELLTNYGEVFEVWFDGANGEGDNGKKQYYDWDRYYRTIRELQPNAVIAVCGPDVRWVGNEAGHTRKNEWSVVPAALRDVERIVDKSQKEDDGEFSRQLSSQDEDFGSKTALEGYDGELVWYPAEVNTSIRPGWFYHTEQDVEVRSSQELFEIYCNSVGGNGTFLLNIPPTSTGLFAENDCQALAELGEKIARLKNGNLFYEGHISYSSLYDESCKLTAGKDKGAANRWRPAKEDAAPQITVTWDGPTAINTISLQEDISDSQRIDKCVISYLKDDKFQKLAEAESVGYKRMLRFEPIKTTAIKIEFPEYREYPTIAAIDILNYQ